MNYFELYGLPVSFSIDEKVVRAKYLELSRRHHPDFFAAGSEEKKEEALEMSTLNTRAFQTLSDFDKRMKYILELKNLFIEGERQELSPDFLMEVMEINEGLMELKIEPDEKKLSQFKDKVNSMVAQLDQDVRPLLAGYNDVSAAESELNSIKDYYHKRKYLLRIRESLDTFGDSQKETIPAAK